jgi:hypothetical protein
MAGVAHGSSVLTRDIDVCLSLSRDNLVRLHAALEDLRPVHRMTPARVPFVAPTAEQHGFENLYLQTDWGQLDCLGFIEGVGRYGDALKESVTITLPSGPCRVLALDALIRSKEALGREKDRLALRELRALRGRRDPPG